MVAHLLRRRLQSRILAQDAPTPQDRDGSLRAEVVEARVPIPAVGPVLEIDEREARGHQGAGAAETGGEGTQEKLQGLVGELAAHAATAGVLLHPLEAVEDDQMGPAVAEATLEALQASCRRTLVFAEKELVALAEEGVGVGPLIERPHQDVGFPGPQTVDDALDDRGLARAAGRGRPGS